MKPAMTSWFHGFAARFAAMALLWATLVIPLAAAGEASAQSVTSPTAHADRLLPDGSAHRDPVSGRLSGRNDCTGLDEEIAIRAETGDDEDAGPPTPVDALAGPDGIGLSGLVADDGCHRLHRKAALAAGGLLTSVRARAPPSLSRSAPRSHLQA